MSKDWVQDISDMHEKYGVRPAVEKMNSLDLRTFLNFRINFLKEELNETRVASNNAGYVDSEEVVDGLIDLCVVAIGTLDAFGVDAYKAWDEVFKANMKKEVGIKETRPNPLGLPDLIKPEGWEAPSHKDNHGDLEKLS
jgi:predicted HAD superfamily Cof-like phosphohydrolase